MTNLQAVAKALAQSIAGIFSIAAVVHGQARGLAAAQRVVERKAGADRPARWGAWRGRESNAGPVMALMPLLQVRALRVQQSVQAPRHKRSADQRVADVISSA